MLVSRDDFHNFQELSEATEFVGGDAVIASGDGSITLRNIDSTEFEADLFHFS